jgi:hypothetical protein
MKNLKHFLKSEIAKARMELAVPHKKGGLEYCKKHWMAKPCPMCEEEKRKNE